MEEVVSKLFLDHFRAYILKIITKPLKRKENSRCGKLLKDESYLARDHAARYYTGALMHNLRTDSLINIIKDQIEKGLLRYENDFARA